MKKDFLKTVKTYPYREKLQRLIYETPAEIAIGGLLMGAVAGGVAWQKNAERANRIPIAFSEIEKTIRACAAEGQPVPPLTMFYSRANDVAMRVFESHNIAHHERTGSDQSFAHELETRVDRALRIYRLITEDAQDMPKIAKDAMVPLAKISQSNAQLPDVIRAFDDAWDERHTHHYKNVRRTRRSCNSEGKCTTHHYTDRVYSHSIHSYTYHPDKGESAARLLDAYLQNNPDLTVEEKLVLATRTGPENEYAMERSMRERFKGKIITQLEALELANTWATGSNLSTYQPVLQNGRARLETLLPAWNAAKGTAHSTRYRTYSRSDSGPREFQTAEKALDTAKTVHSAGTAITGGVQFAGKAVPQLAETIQEFIGVALDNKPGDAKKLRRAVITQAQDIYQKNFANGLDVHPFKWEQVLLFTVLGMALGGAIGAGVDHRLNYRNGKRTRLHAFHGFRQPKTF